MVHVRGTRTRVRAVAKAQMWNTRGRKLDCKLDYAVQSRLGPTMTKRAWLFTASFACFSSDFIDHEYVLDKTALFS